MHQTCCGKLLHKTLRQRICRRVTQTDLITTREACELLGIDRGTLSRWVDKGKISPAWKVPGLTGARLFHRRDVKALKGKIGRTAS